MNTHKDKDKIKNLWLSGYYDPSLVDDIDKFMDSFSYGAHAGIGWIYFESDYYSLKDIKEKIKNPPPDDVFTEEDYKNENL